MIQPPHRDDHHHACRAGVLARGPPGGPPRADCRVAWLDARHLRRHAYALVLAALIRDLGMTTATAGLLGSLTLVASAAGGVLFGVVADRYGRTRALSLSVLIYSVFTAACGLATVGGAARRVPRPARHRHGRRVGERRSTRLRDMAGPPSWQGPRPGAERWAIGYGLAAIVTALVLPRWGWRAVFFVGIAARHPHLVDPAARAGAGDVAEDARRPRRPARAVRRHLSRTDGPAHARRHR